MIMSDLVEVTQADRDGAAGILLDRLIHICGAQNKWINDDITDDIVAGRQDQSIEVQALAIIPFA
jgi:hypothetical protein